MRQSDMKSEHPELGREGHGRDPRAPHELDDDPRGLHAPARDDDELRSMDPDEPRSQWFGGRRDERFTGHERDDFERRELHGELRGHFRDRPFADERPPRWQRGPQGRRGDFPRPGERWAEAQDERDRPPEGMRLRRREPWRGLDPRDEGRPGRDPWGQGEPIGRGPTRRSFGGPGEPDEVSRPSRRPPAGLDRDYGWNIRDDYRYGRDYYGGDLGDEDRFSQRGRDLWTQGPERRRDLDWEEEARLRSHGLLGAHGYSGFQSPDYQPGTRWRGPEPRLLRGPYFGRGPRNYQRSDERISEDIHERLTAHPEIDASDVEIEVKGGEVTVIGSVEDRWTRHRVEDVIDEVLGVREIDNKLRIHRDAGGFERRPSTPRGDHGGS